VFEIVDVVKTCMNMLQCTSANVAVFLSVL